MRPATIVDHWAECGRWLYSPWCSQCGRRPMLPVYVTSRWRHSYNED